MLKSRYNFQGIESRENRSLVTKYTGGMSSGEKRTERTCVEVYLTGREPAVLCPVYCRWLFINKLLN